MSELPDFLLARVAEDEERINAWAMGGALWPHEEHDAGECDECDHRREHRGADDELTGRLLDECAAKRRIVAHLRQVAEEGTEYSGWVYFAEMPLRVLARVYDDHPSFNEAWRSDTW